MKHSSRRFRIAARAVLGALLLSGAMLLAQPHGAAGSAAHGDSMIHAYLIREADRMHHTFLDGVDSKAAWEERRERYLQEYLYMLGLSPMPEKTPLEATVTGTLEGDGYEVDLIHFQSSPGLYVTGNLYRPVSKNRGERFPTVLYVCGHADRGRNGNKAAYQSNGIWFARHGYVCLMIDTLQRGEIAGIHHGTYREKRWWWQSRGYTSAGVECWNGIRAIDYLLTRDDVDADRIGVTGISGGGAASFWIAAADERVKVAIPISGMADLPSYVGDRVVNGHCDCMFLYNTYEWPWARIAGLVAPRPLLFVNSHEDPIFPMNANERVSNRLETIYSLYGASDQVETVVSRGGHAYREDLRKAVYRFMNLHLKGDPRPVLDSEVDLVVGERGRETHPISPERLRVFPTDADIPQDQRNATIDQHFVPVAERMVPEMGEFAQWKADLISDLKEFVFRRFPERIPAARPIATELNGTTTLETEAGIEVGLSRLSGPTSPGAASRIVLVVNTEETTPDELLGSFADSDAVYLLDPRGVGATRWSSRNPPNYVARSHALLGRTVDDGRVWDVIAAARYLISQYGETASLVVAGEGAGAVLGAYAMALEPGIGEGVLVRPCLSHMDPGCPPLLNVLRVGDLPDVLGSLAPRELDLRGVERGALEKVSQLYRSAKAEEKLVVDELLP